MALRTFSTNENSKNLLVLGIDGGGTSCRGRLVDCSGKVLGQGSSGPANTTRGLDAVMHNIDDVVEQCMIQSGLGDVRRRLVVVAGLAGLTLADQQRSIERVAHPYARFVPLPDVVTACIGANDANDGGVVVVGTGSAACAIRDGMAELIGGWGFLVSDHGSAARLGRAAVEYALLANDDIEPGGTLARELCDRLGGSADAMVSWVLGATPRDFGQLAPVALAHARQGDPEARGLVMRSAEGPSRLVRALSLRGAERIVLIGGMASAIRPWLTPDVSSRLHPAAGDAIDGALHLAFHLIDGGEMLSISHTVTSPAASESLHERTREQSR